MDFTNRVSRSAIAEQLGVLTQTIAKWERMGTFPQAKEHVSDRVSLSTATRYAPRSSIGSRRDRGQYRRGERDRDARRAAVLDAQGHWSGRRTTLLRMVIGKFVLQCGEQK